MTGSEPFCLMKSAGIYITSLAGSIRLPNRTMKFGFGLME